MSTVEVPQEFGEYLPDDRIETEHKVREAFREFVKTNHGDQGGDGERFIDMDEMTDLRDKLIHKIEDVGGVEVETKSHTEPGTQKETAVEDLIEDNLQYGLDFYTDSVEHDSQYDVIDAHNTENLMYATIDKPPIANLSIQLKLGLEIDPYGEEINAEATYFADGIGQIEKVNMDRSYEAIIEGLEEDPSDKEMFKRGLRSTGAWMAKNAEEEILPKYSQ
jgi:hypothetical protein